MAKKIAKKTPRERRTPEADWRFARVAAAFARDPRVSRKRMFSSNNVLSVEGKIFAMLVRENLVVKLQRNRVDELVRLGRGEHFDPGHGRLMKEWVVVAPGGADWTALAREAYAFVTAVSRPSVSRKPDNEAGQE